MINTPLKISFGNLKLPKDTMIFNLPACITCPGRTPYCQRVCYARKAERMYSNVLPARRHNLSASRQSNFWELMGAQLAKNSHKIKRVRIHESGDFYNQEYLNKWFEIARSRPGIRFYAYTKSFNLDFSARPANFWLLASFDESTSGAALAMYHSKKLQFQNTFTIIRAEDRETCPGDCRTCSKCWTGAGRKLTIHKH